MFLTIYLYIKKEERAQTRSSFLTSVFPAILTVYDLQQLNQ
ncbi:hypothetical protein RV17_GL000773 [Enterococcus thailandicus]|nr:hypothetical protein RV17_GL000773 [Enterococcus thailandicus]